MNKNDNIDKYKYSGYGVGIDRKGSFSFPATEVGRDVITFGVDMSSSIKTDNRTKDILILGKGARQGLEHMLSEDFLFKFAL